MSARDEAILALVDAFPQRQTYWGPIVDVLAAAGLLRPDPTDDDDEIPAEEPIYGLNKSTLDVIEMVNRVKVDETFRVDTEDDDDDPTGEDREAGRVIANAADISRLPLLSVVMGEGWSAVFTRQTFGEDTESRCWAEAGVSGLKSASQIAAEGPVTVLFDPDASRSRGRGTEPPAGGHEFLPVDGHPDDDECTHRSDGTDATYCGEPASAHRVGIEVGAGEPR